MLEKILVIKSSISLGKIYFFNLKDTANNHYSLKGTTLKPLSLNLSRSILTLIYLRQELY
jgi:hypothetical protein